MNCPICRTAMKKEVTVDPTFWKNWCKCGYQTIIKDGKKVYESIPAVKKIVNQRRHGVK